VSDLVVGWESWASMWPDAEPLARAHYAEVEGQLALKRPFRVHVEAMQAINDAGILRLVTARLDGRLLAYCTWNVQPDVESWGLVMANQGAIYAADGFAGLNLCRRMLDFSIHELRAFGVDYLLLHHRMLGRGARLGSLFARIKAIFIKREFFLWIGRE
jgi:hypothetical protein